MALFLIIIYNINGVRSCGASCKGGTMQAGQITLYSVVTGKNGWRPANAFDSIWSHSTLHTIAQSFCVHINFMLYTFANCHVRLTLWVAMRQEATYIYTCSKRFFFYSHFQLLPSSIFLSLSVPHSHLITCGLCPRVTLTNNVIVHPGRPSLWIFFYFIQRLLFRLSLHSYLIKNIFIAQ